ncbi:filamentous hemagglutinin N-terminal domain-containing protein [Derxia lacustris]|uniref:filamentous hemagglutinin N-terminal domain-containing protein n=1 Tax=Derxia lacustris TaxID=764842 RepID=UPI0015937EC6|nr:filamentous hemagglutinin N-terminal domain-containing protein [Derxia lacustris]
MLRTLCMALAAALGGMAAARAGGLPSGGSVTVGSASIGGDAKTVVIEQSSARLGIDWQSFNIGAGNAVVFHQPSASAIALNRVVGNEKSVIDGSLTANGQVFLVNANGVLFGQGASVNTAGLVASTLDLLPADFAAGSRSFGGSSGASVSNAGSLAAASGGYVALIGANVSNTGSIAASQGTVALAAGKRVTLRFEGDSLLGLSVDAGVLAALVENGGAIQADGGRIVLTAGAADALLAGQVNNSGVLQARSLDELRGSIELSAPGGAVTVGGSLLASAASGAGGSIATSGKTVTVTDSAIVSTHADAGATGSWTLAADSVTVGSGGTVTGATLGRLLASNNIALDATAGDLALNDAVAWSADTALGLRASGAVAFAAPLGASGDAASLSIDAGSGYGIDMSKGAAIALPGAHAALSIDGAPYTLIHNLDELAATVAPDLTATGNFALANDIDASGRTWSDSVLAGTLVGTLAGLGHTISGLRIGTDKQDAAVALIAQVGWGMYDEPLSVVRDIALVDAKVSSSQGSAATLLAQNSGLVSNAHASGEASGKLSAAGLVLRSDGFIADSSADVTVSGSDTVGGLVGSQGPYTSIVGSHATGSVTLTTNTSGGSAGGLVGSSIGNITDSYATGAVTATGGDTPIAFIGGLVGYGSSTSLVRTWASGAVTVTNGYNVGGLIGADDTGWDTPDYKTRIESSYSTGPVTIYWNLTSTIGNNAGGLVGKNSEVPISDSYSTSNVTVLSKYAFDYVGGLVGNNAFGTITGSHASGNVYASGNAGWVGGFAGNNAGGNISNSSASGNVTGDSTVGGFVGANGGVLTNVTVGRSDGQTVTVVATGNDAGGIAGQNYGIIDRASTTANVTAKNNAGGAVGSNFVQTGNDTEDTSGEVRGVTASGDVTSQGVGGGLVGYNGGAVIDSSATGSVHLASGAVGKLVGEGPGSVVNSSYRDVAAEEAARLAAEEAARLAREEAARLAAEEAARLAAAEAARLAAEAAAQAAAEAAARAAADAAARAAAEAAARAAADAAAQAAAARASTAAALGAQQTADARQAAVRTPADLDAQGPALRIPRLDANLLFKNVRGYSASVSRIEVNGQIYEIDDDEAPKPPR